MPHYQVRLVIPNFIEVWGPKLIARFGVPLRFESALPEDTAAEILQDQYRKAGISKIAYQSVFDCVVNQTLIEELKEYGINPLMYGAYVGMLTVKKKQHDLLYPLVASLMAALGITEYALEDPVANVQLSGTYISPNIK